jgi:hypothetical protein
MTGAERSAADGATPVTGAGDRDGFAALFDRHRRELQVYCYRMLGSFHEAEDLVQETFERAWRAIDGSMPARRCGPGCTGSPPTRVWMRCGNAGAGGSGRCRRPRASCGWSRSRIGCWATPWRSSAPTPWPTCAPWPAATTTWSWT